MKLQYVKFSDVDALRTWISEQLESVSFKLINIETLSTSTGEEYYKAWYVTK